MREFFGFGGFTRPAEGFLSWQHLTFVSGLVAVMIFLAVLLGLRNKAKPMDEKNKVLIGAAILMDGLELFKIVIMCFRNHTISTCLYELPLFLCSIQLITIPMASFANGRIKEAAMDFVSIFGILGAVLGTYGAGNNYSAMPVLSFDNMVSGVTHVIAGFSSLYIMISGINRMKRKNIWITFTILLCFCVAAFVANKLIGYNYMFLVAGDGTPYDIWYNIVKGHPVWYPAGVVGMFLLYICGFYGVYNLVIKKKEVLV